MIERLIDATIIIILGFGIAIGIVFFLIGWLLVLALAVVYSKWFLFLLLLYPIIVATFQYLWDEGII